MINCVIVVAKQAQKRKDHVADALSHLSKTVSDRKTFADIILLLLLLLLLLLVVKPIFPISRTIQNFQED